MADYDNPQDLAHLFVNFTDLVTGHDTPPEQTEIEVVYGVERSETFQGKVTLFGRARESAVWVETWKLWSAGGENLGIFRCYDDRRRQHTRRGGGFGAVERDGESLYVWDAKAPVAGDAD